MTAKHIRRAVSLLALLFLILLTLRQTPAETLPQAGSPAALYQLESQAMRQGWTLEGLLMAGTIWQSRGDVTRALPYWEAAEDPHTLWQRAGAYLSLQRWADAADALNQLVQAAPDNFWAQYHLGLLRLAFDPQDAAAHLQTASRSATFNQDAAVLLRVVNSSDDALAMRAGLALASLDLWAYAELAFQHAADLGQSYAEALAYVSLARDRQGKDGSESIHQAMIADSQNATVRYLLGLHRRATGDLDGSRDALAEAVALDPNNPGYYAELSSAYRLLGDLDNAERWLRVALDTSNDDPRFSQMLALFYADEVTQLDDESLTKLKDLADTADLRAVYAWTLYKLGDSGTATDLLDSILEATPDEPRALFYRAQIYIDGGDFDLALPMLQSAAAEDSPVQVDARRMLDAITGGS